MLNEDFTGLFNKATMSNEYFTELFNKDINFLSCEFYQLTKDYFTKSSKLPDMYYITVILNSMVTSLNRFAFILSGANVEHARHLTDDFLNHMSALNKEVSKRILQEFDDTGVSTFLKGIYQDKYVPNVDESH